MKKRLLNKSTQKLLSVMLASAMLFVSIPMSVIGEGLTIGQIGADDNATLVDPTDSFYEDVAMRDEFSKHYVLESGERYAVIFPEAVHYDDGGEWKEVDNRLTYNVATGKYVSANPKFTAAFADNAASGELVSISDGEHTVSWGISFAKNSGGELMNVSASEGQISVTNGADTAEKLADAKAAQASITRASAETSKVFDKEAAEATYKNAVTDMGKASSGISYANVMGEAVSLRYSVAHGKVEEDIILRSKSDLVSYTMTVNTGGLVLTANEDGSVSFKTADGETVFVIDAPWMKDSAYGFSKDIDVAVTQTGNTATVTYTPSAEWLNSPDRVYPVLIDPTVTSNSYTNCFEDTHILSGETDFTYHSNSTTLYVGMSPIGEWTTYIKITYFPNFNNQDVTISDGSLVVCTPYYQNYPLNLYETMSSWCGQTNAQIPTVDPIAGEHFSWYNETYGKYSYSLGMWVFFDKINTDYDGDYSNYFSNVYDGFMINSFSSASDEVTQLDSTEAGAATPMMTLEYTINEGDLPEDPDPPEDTMDSCFADNGIYNIILENSQNCVTVQNGLYVMGTNIYGGVFNNYDYQSFYFVNCGNGKYKIKPVNSNNKVIGFDYAFAEDNDYADVKLYDEFDGYTENEEDNIFWRIEYINDEKVKISSYANPEFVLTLDMNHSILGSAMTTDGNIIIRENNPDISDMQTWQILSGGNVIYQASEIREVTDMILNVYDSVQLNAARTDLNTSIAWSTSNNDVANVSINGYITTVGIGTVTISASEISSGGESIINSLSLTVVLPDPIEFCFKDFVGQKAMCFDSNSANSVKMSNWEASENQIWISTYYNGYYTIQYPEWGYLSVSGSEVLLSSSYYSNPLDTQLWRITSLGDGIYKIQSKYHESEGSNLVLAQGDDGEVILQNYTDDNDYNDVWNASAVYDSTFIATKDPNLGNVHIASHDSVLESLHDMGYNSNRIFEQVNTNSCIEYMSTSKIIFTVGHGDIYGIDLSNGRLTSFDLDLLPDDSFILCKLVLYGACNTALGGEDNSSNLVNITHDKGVATVVGFEDKVETEAMNSWAEAFFENLSLGQSVSRACYNAVVLLKENANGTDSYIIVGSKTQTFN